MTRPPRNPIVRNPTTPLGASLKGLGGGLLYVFYDDMYRRYHAISVWVDPKALRNQGAGRWQAARQAASRLLVQHGRRWPSSVCI